jgi:eukaryotic-like serine/threonine-protein kinase
MAKKKVTGIGIGTPIASASLSWEDADKGNDGAHDPKRGCLVLAGARLPKVREVSDPIILGVHPSSRLAGFSYPPGEHLPDRVPAYVLRDIDDELRKQLAKSSFVILVGDSSAGKTRAAFEAVSVLGDHVLIVPNNREALTVAIDKAANARRCVLWLDDLEAYLGAGGLTRADTARILGSRRSHRVIIATLRSAEETLLTAGIGGEANGLHASKSSREVLEQAYRIHMLRLFSQSEIERARAKSWDPRIADALDQANKYGVAEYLAAGPELLRDWEDAWSPNTDPRVPSHPRAAALIAGAIDMKRAGFTSPLPRSLVTKVHEHYLQLRGGPRLRPEAVADAWAWATSIRRATTALLQSIDDEHVLVFDYLLDAVQARGRPGDYVPGTVLEAALAVCTPSDAQNMAIMAFRYGAYEFAETAWLSSYNALAREFGPEHPGTLEARNNRANILRELGRPTEAESEHRAVADISERVFGPEHPQVLTARNSWSFALIRLGKSAAAEEELRAIRDLSSRVLGPQHHETMTSRHLRAIALHNLGRLAEAETENRAVLAAWTREFGPDNRSTLYSRANLAEILCDTGRREEAAREIRAVLDIRTRVFGPQHPETRYERAFLARIEGNSS